MTQTFTRSSRVIKKLAQDGARTPPSDKDPPFDYVDKSLTILGYTFDIQSQWTRRGSVSEREFIANEFRGVDRRLVELDKKTDGRFQQMENKMDRGFQEVENKMDQRFQEVENKMDRRFQEFESKIDRRFEEVDGKWRRQLDHLQKASKNTLRTRGWEEIYPVGPLDDRGGVRIPQYFPRTVKHFWKLKMPSRREFEIHTYYNTSYLLTKIVYKLIYLIRFYNVQGYEEWGTDAESHEWGDTDSDDDTRSSKSSILPVPVESAVRSNPEIAHRALAAQLGLVYDEIEKFMERAQAIREAQSKEMKKRGRDVDDTARKRWPFKRSSDEEGTDVTSPTNNVGSSQEMGG
jgi:hypothetical protein